MTTRGIRNNNPGNIDYNSSNNWKGQVGIEDGLPKGVRPRFAKFEAPEYGIRAICELLQTYSRKYGADTIEEIVSRYAPSNENKTDKYAENVSRWSGIPMYQTVDVNSFDVLAKLIPAIIRQENGVQPYTQKVIENGIRMSL